MRKELAVLFIGVGLLIAVVCYVAFTGTPPRYNGKTVLELSRITALNGGERRLFGVSDGDARNALNGLRVLGPQAEEALIRQMQTRDTTWRRAYKAIWLRLPLFAKRVLPPFVNAAYRRQTAVNTLGKLGVLPARTERALVLACYDPDPVVRAHATQILGYRGSRSRETVQAVKDAMRDPQISLVVIARGPAFDGFDLKPKTIDEMILGLSRPLQEARYLAASALRDLGPHAQPAIPALIKASEDTDDLVRVVCVRALGQIGVPASNAIPTLQRMLKDESSFARSAAAEAIQQIHSPLRGGNQE